MHRNSADVSVLCHVDSKTQALLREYGWCLVQGSPVIVVPSAASGVDDILQDFSHTVCARYLRTDLRRESNYLSATSSQLFHVGDYRRSLIGFLTSGTSGLSKGVLYASSVLLTCGHAIAQSLALTRSISALSFVPQEYAFGLSIIHSHLVSGSPVTFVNPPNIPDELDSALDIDRSVNIVYMLPLQAALLAAARARDVTRQIHFVVAGGRLSSKSAQQLAAKFPGSRLSHMYGQAELGPRVAVWTGEIASYSEGNVGYPIEGVRLAVTADAAEQPQVLWVASPYRMLRYLGEVDRANKFVDAASSEWWRTGDAVRFSSTGELYVVGRTSQYINLAGVRILVSDLERLVNETSGVSICKVEVRSHETLGDVPAIQVIASGASADLVQRIRIGLAERLGRVAGSLITIEVVQQLTVNSAGKI